MLVGHIILITLRQAIIHRAPILLQVQEAHQVIQVQEKLLM